MGGRKKGRKEGRECWVRIDYSKQKAQNGLIFKIQVSEYDKI